MEDAPQRGNITIKTTMKYLLEQLLPKKTSDNKPWRGRGAEGPLVDRCEDVN